MRTAKLSLVTLVLAIVAAIFGSSMQSATAATPASSSATVQTSTATSTKHTSTAAASAKSGNTKATSQHNIDADTATDASKLPATASSTVKTANAVQPFSNAPMDTKANSPPTGTQQGTVSVTVTSTQTSYVHEQITAATAVSTSTKTQLQFIVKTGYHPKHPKYHYIKKGAYYTNTGGNRSGGITKFTDRCGDGSPYTHPLTSGKHKGYCVFYWDATHHVWRKPDCGNYVYFSGKLPKLTYKTVTLYKSFGNITFKQTVLVSGQWLFGYSASCTIPGGGSTTSTVSTFKYSFYAYFYVSAKFSSQAKSTGSITAKEKSSFTATAKTKFVVEETVSVKQTCTYTPPPVQTCQPGQTGTYPNCITPCPPGSTGPGNGNCVYPQAPSVSASAESCVAYGGNSGVVDVTVNNPNTSGDTATVSLHGQTMSKPVGASSQVSFQFTGFAPGTYNGMASLSVAGKSTGFSVTVAQCPPPAITAPHILSVSTVNDVLISNTRTITVTGTVASGHTAQLFATAKNGGTITVNKTQTVSGSFHVTVTYLAPSEVPSANGDIAAGKDRVDFTLTQDDSQSDSASTNQFGITQPVPDPQAAN